ncbi:polysaccharide pyruvyl transferase family protein [Barnesiella viscericola]|uniref:polysaccharide pyruvyl transferase family protein n=1 Tax=Barnesiella viscericola TaxID=397865 RepID=UPI0025A480F7|nr:polysaccharide pyruvyl transferase family protein [Barnesiella viscericola]MDM8269668.1 polysaccharide pyruvyl transferase family protein [Barnesiella viscericola]
MRIGIVTLPLLSNYGGILQAWALQTVLMKLGNDVKVINKKFDRPTKSSILCKHPERLLKKYVFRENIPIFQELLVYEDIKQRIRNIEPFIRKHIYQRIVSDLSEIEESEFDALVFGSDQVWRPAYFLPNYPNMVDAFGAFANKWSIRRLSYAASFGLDNLNEFGSKDIVKIEPELHQFSGISVREATGVELCKNYFHVEAVHVLDPTMLLPKESYLGIAEDVPADTSGLVLEYILDPDVGKKVIIENFSQKLKFPKRSFSPNFGSGIPQASVEAWLAGFRDAMFIITDSFHACVFSIIFQKPFVVIANPDRGLSRIESLLTMFNLRHHLITSTDQIKSIDSYEIDSSVYDTLVKWQFKSMNFLKSALS